MDSESFRSSLPEAPGVYMFRDRSDNIIYIGKAKQLRNRVRSYFQDSRHEDAKLEALRERIASFEYILTQPEADLILLIAKSKSFLDNLYPDCFSKFEIAFSFELYFNLQLYF